MSIKKVYPDTVLGVVMRNVVTISLVIFLVPLAGCVDESTESTEPTKSLLGDTEMIIDDGQFYKIGPTDGYGQFEWELTYIPTEGESNDSSWNVYLVDEPNFQQFEGGNSFLFYVNGSWESMDGNGTKGPTNLNPSESYYLIVDNWRNNENGESLRFRIQFFGWK